MIKKFIPIILSLMLVLYLFPASASAQIQLTLQNKAVANGNGETLNTDGRATAVLTVNCATCSGGTQVLFEGTQNGTDYVPVNAVAPSGSSSGTGTLTSGVTVWSMPVAGLLNIRARITGYSVGTVTVTGVAVSASSVSTSAGSSSSVTATGAAADGVAVSGNPVRIAGKDGSGNTQDIITDSTGNQVIVGTGTFVVQATIADNANATLGAKADAKSTATDTTPATLMSVSKQISASVQALAALANTDPCSGALKTYVPISITTAATTQLIAASASNKAYICSVNIGPIEAVADNVAFVEDDTSACASPTAGIIGGTTTATGWNFPASGGTNLGNGGSMIAVTASTNRYVCLITSSAAEVMGGMTYVLAP